MGIMNKTSKNMVLNRILAFALSFVMVFTSTPVVPMAYGEPSDAVDTTPVVISGDDLVQVSDEGSAAGEPSAQGDAPAAADDVEDGAAPADVLAPAADDAASAGAAALDAAAAEPATVSEFSRLANNASQTVSVNTTQNLSYTSGEHTLTINPGVTLTGQITVSGGAKLTIKGLGTINGNKQGSVIIVEPRGSLIIGDENGGPTITGGIGSNLNHKGYDGKPSDLNGNSTTRTYTRCGGGILARADSGKSNGGSLTFINGTVRNNSAASAGGGIFIDQSCTFLMKGGTVSDNVAKDCEGGGIYTAAAKSVIEAGSIVNNETKTDWSWGGGGIFVEGNGILRMTSVAVTNNTANGLGGGIAGCPHARLGISLAEGVALYGNNAKKISKPNHMGLYNNEVDGKQVGDILAYETFKDGFKAELAKDFYGTRASVVKGTSLDGNKQTVMVGYRAGYHAGSGTATGENISLNAGDTYSVTNESVGFTSTYKGSVSGSVTISGNTSTTHGGGIGCNGTLLINYEAKDEYGAFSIDLQKLLVTSLEDKLGLQAGAYTFELFDDENCTTKLAEATNDASGKITFTLTSSQYANKRNGEGAQKWTFYAKEKPGSDANITYDKAVHTISVNISSIKATTVGSAAFPVTTWTPIVKSVTVDGKSPSSKPFTNTYNVEGTGTLGVTKRASGLPEGTYNFELQEMTATGNQTNVGGFKVKQDGEARTASVTVTDSTKGIQTQTADFSPIVYTCDGTYWYRVQEVAGSNQDVSYDTGVYFIQVDVTKSGDKKSLRTKVVKVLKAADGSNATKLTAVDNTSRPTFTNANYVYQEAAITIKKQLQNDLGMTFDPAEGEIMFALYESKADADVKANPISEAATTANGTVTFSLKDQALLKSLFQGKNQGDTVSRAFWFRELSGTDNRVKLDDRVRTMDVTFTVAKGTVVQEGVTKWSYSATSKVSRVDGTDVADSTYRLVNDVTASDATVTFDASKIYTGEKNHDAGQFGFVLEALDPAGLANLEDVTLTPRGDSNATALTGIQIAEDGQSPLRMTARNQSFSADADEDLAPVSFGTITYNKSVLDGQTKKAIYWYRVTEDFLGNESESSYDPTVFVAKVELAASNREIVPTVTYYQLAQGENGAKRLVSTQGDGTMKPVFYNTDDVYQTMGFSIDKLYENSLGRPVEIEGEQFSFTLRDITDPNNPVTITDESGNPQRFEVKDGKVTFVVGSKKYVDKEHLGETKTFVFEVTENAPEGENADRVTADTANLAKDKVHTVEVSVRTDIHTTVDGNGHPISTSYEPVITGKKWDGEAWPNGNATVTNTLNLSTEFAPVARKYFSEKDFPEGFGDGVAVPFKFELTALNGSKLNEENVVLDLVSLDDCMRSDDDFIDTMGSKIVDNGKDNLVLNASIDADKDKFADGVEDATFRTITYEKPGSYWYAIHEVPAEGFEDVAFDPSVVVIRVDVSAATNGKSMEAKLGAVYHADSMTSVGLSSEFDGTAFDEAAFYNSGYTYKGLSFNITKKFENTEGIELPMEQFAFELYDGDPATDDNATLLGTYSNEEGSDGAFGSTVTFTLGADDDNDANKELLKRLLRDNPVGEELSYDNLYIREVASDDADYLTDAQSHRVRVLLTPAVERPSMANPMTDETRTTTYSATQVAVGIDDLANGTVTNRLQLHGSWRPQAHKTFYGSLSEDGATYTFSVRGLEAVDEDALDSLTVGDLIRSGDAAEATEGVVDDNGTDAVTAAGTVTVTDPDDIYAVEHEANIDFDSIAYAAGGTYWYAMTEDSGADPTVFIFKVEVTNHDEDNRSLDAQVTAVYYADSLDSQGIYPTASDPVPDFVNTSSSMVLGAYRAFAASGQPVDQKCLVDPKMYKALEGRTLREGEFTFDLIKVDNYTDTVGEVISTATNDRYGMVDFDKANPVAGTEDDPCCLEFSQPGIYRYRVVENAEMSHDPSVIYSDQIITFTVDVRLDDQTGQLSAVDMYYGEYKDGENVRFSESADPTWHPTMTNKARGSNLKVRKTSVLDRNQGLEGATYSLFMVNEGIQDDVKVATGTSDADGWILFEDVNLQQGQLYYFKEFAAPAGHTVSEFRSPYFYLVSDAESPNGYSLAYSDTKDINSGAAAQADELEAVVEPTADGNATAGDALVTQPVLNESGDTLYTYAKDGGVYDEATIVSFNKQETNTHEWVSGAKLQIIEKATGRVVHEWTSGERSETLTAALNVDTGYILHEVEAPEGYAVAEDVEFVIDSYGNVQVSSGTSNGNALLTDDTIALFDRLLDVEEVDRQTRTLPNTGQTTRGNVAKTGDVAGFAAPLMGLAAVAVGATALVLRRNRRRDD